MSIPPLVCSTPPPPDQCEDDKDHEDFDMSYSLSQDDDGYDESNGYNYEHFSSYNNYKSAPDSKSDEIKIPEIKEDIVSENAKDFNNLKYDSEEQSGPNFVIHNFLGTSDINENKLKCDEDVNIEDLNLTVDEDSECIVESNSVQIDPGETHSNNVKNLDIPHSSANDSPLSDNINLQSFEENPEDKNDEFKELNAEQSIEDANVSEGDLHNDDVGSLCESDEQHKFEETVIKLEPNQQTSDPPHCQSNTVSEEQTVGIDIDDDFGDFDDFQSVTTKSNITSIIDKSDDPWGNSSSHVEFGNFAANFEENNPPVVKNIVVNNVTVSNNLNEQSNDLKETNDNLEDDDDFGDFDDFQSSSIKTGANEHTSEDPSQCHEFPVLNLHSSETECQVLERITKVLSSVFLEEISDPESDYESNLESLLSETWGHLMEIDERQPYIVNWNSSLGQKTLLKALCIDSRNILFGPKWSSNMPKYAVNLSNAPLQPQKQTTIPSFVTQTDIVPEKNSSKPTTWNDPGPSDGQESCNTENESASITPGPTDLDVFEGASSTKSDKIYSNTLGVQPLRQINLPDTHIFTPTDSEIPRSKTIHYNQSPAVMMPQLDKKHQIDTVNIPNISGPIQNNIDDNEYWEFQDFKSTSVTSSGPNNLPQATLRENNFETARIVNALPQPNIAYQTDLLQPIRVEHALPTALNWPDPGEIKGEYDDFSDFVSISQPIESQDRKTSWPTESPLENADNNKFDSFTDIKTEVAAEISNPVTYTVDDDFDNFQSALPSNTSPAFTSSFQESPYTQKPPSLTTAFDNATPKFDSTKSDTISFDNIARPNKALKHNVGLNSNQSELTSKSSLPSISPMATNILQPSPASSSSMNTQTQQKPTQILQPLSLESYSQINWPSPGIDLQDLSRFNPVETLHSLKSDLSTSSLNKTGSPVKSTMANQATDDDGWGEFVSSKPKQQPSQPKKPSFFVDDDEWTDFISSPSVKPINGLNTISLNVHTHSNIQKSVQNKLVRKSNQPPLDIPTLNYITPKSNPHMSYSDKHFQNL